MAEFFIELFSEEIPARMQAGAAAELARICGTVLAELKPSGLQIFYGPRRVALAATVAAEKSGGTMEVRGPREGAADAALAGFLAKHKAARDELVIEGGFFLLRRNEPAVAAAGLIAAGLPGALAKFSWPKSMRWGQSGDFTWVRPLRRMICLLDGVVVPITLGPVTAGHETQGHRFMAPGAFAATSAADWQAKLRERKVIADQAARRALVVEGLNAVAAKAGLTVVEDAGLVDEVSGLVEWPVALLGRIDADFMGLPPEVRELSMKVNQRYFALRDAAGQPAPYFAFAANIEARDGGAAIIAGNERVLKARLADARHFWELDLKTPLNALLPKLGKITFHAKIGTQLERSERIAALAEKIALTLEADLAQADAAKTAGRLCKADLVTGMVGEFPELQGIMGGYYAERHELGWDGSIVGPAIKTHYQPKGPSDAVPGGVVAVSVALADKLDTLIQFFQIGEKPTGSGDPYALRRAALGVIRIILENDLNLPLRRFISNDELFSFIIERLRVKLRGEGQRFDVLDAVLAAGTDDQLVRVMQRVNAVSAFLATEDGANLLIAYRRAANILRIESDKNQGVPVELYGVDIDENTPPDAVDQSLLRENDEANLNRILVSCAFDFDNKIRSKDFGPLMSSLAGLRPLVDAFFNNVTVNVGEPELRRNRLLLLARFRDTVDQIADFSKIEG